jgi:hypothetical protein
MSKYMMEVKKNHWQQSCGNERALNLWYFNLNSILEGNNYIEI